jgi:hypothetical protein
MTAAFAADIAAWALLSFISRISPLIVYFILDGPVSYLGTTIAVQSPFSG